MRAACLLVAALATFDAGAACTVSALPVVFGSYNPVGGQAVESTGSVDIVCVPIATYTVALSAGVGSFAARAMASGPNRLPYNLYTTASRTIVWGDGTSGTAMLGGTAATASYPVYGRIPASQNVPVGVYADTITVTVNF
jgi:spore coat protein U-like protein